MEWIYPQIRHTKDNSQLFTLTPERSEQHANFLYMYYISRKNAFVSLTTNEPQD